MITKLSRRKFKRVFPLSERTTIYMAYFYGKYQDFRFKYPVRIPANTSRLRRKAVMDKAVVAMAFKINADPAFYWVKFDTRIYYASHEFTPKAIPV